jgi:sugar lactone lactonase YvrE
MTKPSIQPHRWRPPAKAPPTETSEPGNMRVYDVSGHGPEDVNRLPDGRIVTGLLDGRIVGIDPGSGDETVIVDTGARPLGIEHHPDGGLVVCDAHRGLLHVDVESGRITTLSAAFEGTPYLFCNNAAVGTDGAIYFTDSSTKFDFDHWRGDLLEHNPSGRLFRRNPDGTVEMLLKGLAFANGVALSRDESFVVVAETAGYSLQRHWLTGPHRGTTEPFGNVLKGFPDNISTGEDGNIWVALASPRAKTLDLLLPRHPALRAAIWALPPKLQPKPKSLIQIQAFDPAGRLVHDIDGKNARFGKATGVRQLGHQVWLGSFETSTIAVLDVPPTSPPVD